MIKSLGTFNIGNYRAQMFLDSYTPAVSIGELYYVFRPPLIEATCVYLRVRHIDGTQREFPAKLKLRLQGDLSFVPGDQVEFDAIEVYNHFQLTDHIFKICVRRSGYYKVLISDKLKNEWVSIQNSAGSSDMIFIEGKTIIDFPMVLGSPWGAITSPEKRKIFFNVYNYKEDIVAVNVLSEEVHVSPISIPGRPSYWSEFFGDWYSRFLYNDNGFGYTSDGKHTFWLDLQSNEGSGNEMVKIVFYTKTGYEMISYVYNRSRSV